MPVRNPRLIRPAVCAALLCLAGCGPKAASVSGTVVFGGKPLPGGSVILYCDGKQIVRGIIGPDGTYSIPNVPPGEAVVTVRAHTPVPPGFRLKQKLPPSKDGPIPPVVESSAVGQAAPVPERYGVPEESGLSVRVGPGHTVYNIHLRP